MKIISFLIISIFALSSNANAGECSKEKAKKEVERVCAEIAETGKKPKTKSLIFENCGKNYIWIQDTDEKITMVSHPIKRRLNGKALNENKDENGLKLFVEFNIEAHRVARKPASASGEAIAAGKHNNAWVDYMWAKPGAEKATAKTSYVKLCQGPNNVSWIAGSGIWKEDLK